MIYIFLFVLSAALSFVLTLLVRNLAMRAGCVSPPMLERHVHTTPIPRVGGIPIFATVLALTMFFGSRLLASHTLPPFKFYALIGTAGLMFVVGLFDDLRSLSALKKLLWQAIIAVLLFASGFRIQKMSLFFGDHPLALLLSLVLTVFWVLLITNALNLIDGLDGLATGSALFPICALSIVSFIYGNPISLFMGVVLGGALIGFLWFNFSPASIFLGDSGSLFIGFMLSALALEGSQKAVVALALAVVSLSLPLADTALAVLRRFLNGKPIFAGDREHIHHKLLQRGLTQRQVVLWLYAVSALLGALSLLLLRPSWFSFSLVTLAMIAGTLVGLRRLGYHEFDELKRIARSSAVQRSVIANDMAFHHAIDQLKNTHNLRQVCAVMQQAFEGNDFDGFVFVAEPYSSTLQFSDLGLFTQTRTGELRFEWNKGDHLNAGAVWSLDLNLAVQAQGTRGSLRIYRGQTNGALLVDVNLITCEFGLALAGALDRAIANSSFPGDFLDRSRLAA